VIVIITLPREIPLLPLAAINKGDILLRELHQRIGLGQVGDNRVGMRLGIAHNIRHQRLTPAVVYGGMTRLAHRRPGVGS